MLKEIKLTPKEVKEMEEARQLERKEWDELTDKEKIERTRKVVKQENQRFSRRLFQLERKLRKLEKHQHLADGKLVVELDYYEGGGEDECASVRNYF